MPDPDYAAAALARRTALGPIIQPKVPAVDHYDLDDGDATHPIFIDYIPPAVATTFGRATLSWKMRAFRSTANLNPSSVGNEASHTHGSAGHAHTIGSSPSGSSDLTGFIQYSDGGTGNILMGGSVGPNTLVSFSTTPGATGTGSSHTHSLTGTAQQAVTDGASATVTALAIDSQDFTAALGGPWAGDVVELDITAVLPLKTGQWHTIQLTLSGLGRVVSMLRLYYA